MSGERTVLVALHDATLNGASISVLRAVPELERLGWRFAWWVPQPGEAAEWLRERGHEVYGEVRPIASGLRALREPPGALSRLRRTPGYLRRYRECLRAVSPALVHANSLYSFAEAMTAKRAGLRTVFHLHDMAPRSRKAWPAREIARRAAHVTVAVSEACAASYAHSGWSPRVVYEAAPIPTEPLALHAEPSPFVIASVGVIAPRKGSDLFVEAAATAKAERDDLEFRLIGSPDDPLERGWAAGVLSRARAVGVKHQPRVDVPAEMPGWDAFVLPSRRDPCPIALLEAMAAGLPVVGARSDGIPEQISPGTGLLVDADDANGLAAAMVEVAAMPHDSRTTMGLAARSRVQRLFSLEAQAEGLDQAYREASEG